MCWKGQGRARTNNLWWRVSIKKSATPFLKRIALDFRWLTCNINLNNQAETWVTFSNVQRAVPRTIYRACIVFFNILRPRQNVRYFADDVFKCIFLSENVWFALKISLEFVPKVPINSIPSLVQIMTWRHSGDKPLSEPMIVSLLTHICVARPQWVKDTILLSHKPIY